MSARHGIELMNKQLGPLLREVVKYLPVLEAVLTEFPELQKREGAEACLAAMRELAAESTRPSPTEFDAIMVEEARLKALVGRVEPVLCEAGTIAWIAAREFEDEDREPLFRAFLKRHEKHREEDRAARIKELRREITTVNQTNRSDRDRIQGQLRAYELREERFGENVDEVREELQRELAASNDVFGQRRGQLEQRIERLEALSIDAICSDRSVI